MNNSSENNHIQSIITKLKALRQKIDEITEFLPQWMSIDSLDEINPEEKREKAFQLIFHTFFLSELEVDMPGQLPSLISVKDREIFDWYKTTYPPAKKKLFHLAEKKMLPGLRKIQDAIERDPPGPGDGIKNAFAGVIDFAQNYLTNCSSDEFDQLIDEFEGLEDSYTCKRVIEKPYFEPDAWRSNELFPFVVTRSLEKIPSRIHHRIREMQRSFVFGNWMSAIAMSRCLLEYVLVERKHIFKMDAYTDEKKTQVRPLSHLIADATKIRPELGEFMTRIQKAGNDVMHPPRQKVSRLPSTKNEAKECIESISEIIGALYRD